MFLLLLAFFIMSVPGAYAAPGKTAPSGLSFEEMEGRIDAIMGEHIGSSTPGAAIVVVLDGEIILSKGYGWADIENQIPIDPAVTVFEFGSISKTFIWVAVMQLVEQGLLDIDADIKSYLPASFEFEKPFTMRDILNHAAGFEDIALGLLLDASGTHKPIITLEEALLETQPRQIFTPGMVSSYSNWGSALAALVVERICGQPYYIYERDNILHKSNMLSTLNQPDWLDNFVFLGDKARGYIVDGAGDFHHGFWSYIPFGYPCGAANGTAEDIAAYIKALTPPAGESGTLFANAETLSNMMTPSSADPVNRPGTYHGFARYSGVLPAFGHGGSTIAFRTNFAVCPETRFGYTVLSNSTGDDVLFDIRELLLGYPINDADRTTGNLPNAASVEGRFITAKRTEGNFLELVAYVLSPILRVTAVDDNTIILHQSKERHATYAQIAPYVYRLVSASDSVSLLRHQNEIRFRLEDGVPVQIHVGFGLDYTALPAGRAMPFLVACYIAAVIALAFFLITPIVALIVYLVHRKNHRAYSIFERFSIGFLLSGTLLTLNNIVMLLRMAVQNYRTVTEMALHIWINYVIAGLAVVLLFCSIRSWIKERSAIVRNRALFVVTAIIGVVFILILHNWRFFELL